jgi:hypothetical protein
MYLQFCKISLKSIKSNSMYKKSINSNKIKLIILVIVGANMALALGILIGQRNNYNTSFAGKLETKTESGVSKNIFSDIKEKTVYGLQEKPVEVGVLKYVVNNKNLDFQLSINAPYLKLKFAKESKDVPLKLSLESLTNNYDETDVIYNKIGEVELKPNGNNLELTFYGTIGVETLQIKQFVLKPINKEDQQSFYLYNEKSLPEKINNSPMPYFWVSL